MVYYTPVFPTFTSLHWKGMYPIGWGDALREAEYTQWVYKHVLGV